MHYAHMDAREPSTPSVTWEPILHSDPMGTFRLETNLSAGAFGVIQAAESSSTDPAGSSAWTSDSFAYRCSRTKIRKMRPSQGIEFRIPIS